MKKIFLLSGANIGLAKKEVLSLVRSPPIFSGGNLLIADDRTGMDLGKRLGFAHSIYKFLFSCGISDIYRHIRRFDWDTVIIKSYSIRAHGENLEEKKIADMIYGKLMNPKVNLKDPSTNVVFFQVGKDVFSGSLLSDVDKSYLERKAHLRPSLHPTSLHPALARACINLTGLKEGTLLDPFCGSGGILIEAGLMGFKVVGYDIEEGQIARARKNLAYYKLKEFTLAKKDATKTLLKADAIVTDLPYGKSSKAGNIEKLYSAFFSSALKYSKNMVVILPDFYDYKKVIKKSGWKIDEKFEIYIHKSLTRIVLKVSPLHH